MSTRLPKARSTGSRCFLTTESRRRRVRFVHFFRRLLDTPQGCSFYLLLASRRGLWVASSLQNHTGTGVLAPVVMTWQGSFGENISSWFVNRLDPWVLCAGQSVQVVFHHVVLIQRGKRRIWVDAAADPPCVGPPL